MDHQQWPIQTLLDKFGSKEIQIPELQRKYVWERRKIRNLLDSIYKDYPSGSILLWETDEKTELRDASVAIQEKEERTRKYLLLDGQQRLTSLLTVINGNPIQIRPHPDLWGCSWPRVRPGASMLLLGAAVH